MDNKALLLAKNILVYIILLVGVIFIVQAMSTEVDPDTNEAIGDVGAVSRSVNLSLGLVIGGLCLIGVFTIISIILNPKRFIPTFIGFGVFGLIVLIGSMMVTVETAGPIMELEEATEGSLFWGGVGIQTTFVLIALALFLIVAQVVRGFVGYFAK